jgi:hypothetical protein
MTHPGRDRFVLVCLAMLAGACGDSSPKSDAPTPCTSGAWLHIALSSTVATMAQPTVTVCRNSVCYTSVFQQLPSTGSGGTPEQAMADAAAITGTLWRSSDGSVSLDIEWRIDDQSLLVDGDHYVVTLADGAGAASAVLDKTASYAMSAPGVADAGPVCLQTTLLAP